MGLNILRSSCTCDYSLPKPVIPDPKNKQPDPRRFEIQQVYAIGNYLVVGVNYLGCTNYEGRKILVFRDLTEEALRSLEVLDPHFCEGSHKSPIARFRPTSEGWKLACAFAARS